MKKVRVLVVEDSMVVRELLLHIIGGDSRLEVAAAVSSAEEALECLDRVAPDVISLDIRLPGMNGLDATLEIMARRPTPIVVISANVESDELNIAMNAMRAGALAVVEKPVGVSHESYTQVARHICTQLVIMSQIQVLKQTSARKLSFGTAPEVKTPAVEIPRSRTPVTYSILGIVASTGGPNVLTQLLPALGANFPLPILMVQHMTDSFIEGFAAWLPSVCPFKSMIVQGGETPKPGCIYLAPPDRHITLTSSGLIRLSNAPPVVSQRPSGTVLFQGMAKAYGPSAIGVLLTGMGSDGADGLLELRNAGGYTIAEDETTAIVYGMPGSAQKIGAVRDLLPLPMIAPRVVELTGRGL
jgi:two-component system chemotaxis response regulator CheB